MTIIDEPIFHLDFKTAFDKECSNFWDWYIRNDPEEGDHRLCLANIVRGISAQ